MPDPTDRGCWAKLISTKSSSGGGAWSYQVSFPGRKTFHRDEYEEKHKGEHEEGFRGASLRVFQQSASYSPSES